MTEAATMFAKDSTPHPVGVGAYDVRLPDRWISLGGTVNGGFMLATCLRALSAELPHPDALAVSAHFLRPGTVGPASISTEMARAGRRTSCGAATLVQEGKQVMRVQATFADLSAAAGPTLVHRKAPVLPAPGECIDPLAGLDLPGVTIADRVQIRMPEPAGFWRGAPGGVTHAEFWMRPTEGDATDSITVAMLVDAAAPVVLDAGVGGSSTLELTVHVRHRPAPGWLACRVRTDYLINGYHEEDFEIWDQTNTLVAQSRQLAIVPG
ncbi:thioesterase family protein [Nocardia salmonicida]